MNLSSFPSQPWLVVQVACTCIFLISVHQACFSHTIHRFVLPFPPRELPRFSGTMGESDFCIPIGQAYCVRPTLPLYRRFSLPTGATTPCRSRWHVHEEHRFSTIRFSGGMQTSRVPLINSLRLLWPTTPERPVETRRLRFDGYCQPIRDED